VDSGNVEIKYLLRLMT